MLNDLLREIVISIVGKPTDEIVELLNSPKHVNEFTIAKKLGITINQTRNILYKISDFGLVSSVRKKDKKKGWYTYYWKFEIMKCLEFLDKILLENKSKIEEEISLRNSKVFYECKSCGLEYDEDEALLMNFTCDECGQLFTVKDNSKMIRDLTKALSKIEGQIEIVNSEMEKEKAKIDRKKALQLKKEEREKKAEEKKKKAERARKAALRKAEREKAKKKKEPSKKVSKKKTSTTSKKKPAKKSTKKKTTKKASSSKKVSKKKTSTTSKKKPAKKSTKKSSKKK